MKTVYNDWHIKMSDSVMKRGYLNEKWSYDYGVVWKGMELVWRKTEDKKYYNYIKECMDSFINDEGKIRDYQVDEYNIDHISNGRAVLMLYNETGSDKYKKAADLLMSQLDNHPRTSEGVFWHKNIYPHQIWLDGIFMGSPFYGEYVKIFGLPEERYDDVAKQAIICEKHTKDLKTGLLYHAWDESREQFWCVKETGCSKNFWGRAMGWYVVALVEVLDYLPESCEGRKKIIDILNGCIDALLKVKDKKTNVFYQVLDQGERPGNYLEASASCMILYSIAKGVQKGYLPSELWKEAELIYEGIITQFIEVTDEGLVNLNKVCRVAGLGNKDRRDGTFAYYISEPIYCNDLKGVGAFILAASLMEK